MAIYSCNLKSIGRTTHDPGTAGAHLRYISRPDADPVILSQHMPDEHRAARTWMDHQERAMRKNARVIDKLRIALPRELTEVQRAALISGFMHGLTGERIPWYAAIHQTGKDALNPHVHIAIHDRDIATGRRVLRLSDNARDREKAKLPGPKAVEWIRERWEEACNAALRDAGHEARVDRRTLGAQGIDREPTIHEGPRAQHIDDHVERPKSQRRINGCGRVIDYVAIDHGRTRREFNAHIIDLNLQKAARSSNPATALWALFEKDEAAKDAKLEARLSAERRARTAERRLASLEYRARITRLRAEAGLKLKAAQKRVRRKYYPVREQLRARQHAERRMLKDKQSRLYIRLIALLDFTGITKRKQEAARKVLSARHKAERGKLSARYHKAGTAVTALIKERYAGDISEQREPRKQHLTQLHGRHLEAERVADHERQQREHDREQMYRITQARLDGWAKSHAAKEGKQGDKASSAFAAALIKTAKQEADHNGPQAHKPDYGYEH